MAIKYISTPSSTPFFLLIFLFLSGCTGGGGSGGGGALYGGAANEFSAQRGLGHVYGAPVYDAGYTGRGIKVGVADSGVDANHPELRGRVESGLDWHQNSDGRIDPHGHGTHVASILAAARDGVGMHGLAPKAKIYPYRVLNSQGAFGRQSGERMIPSLVTDARRRGVSILNNSWTSNLHINNVSKRDVETGITAELAAWQDAVNAGMVMVWAAGNYRKNEVGVRAGLPHHFSSLRAGWLAVVSSGSDGREPSYTNRCGLAANWCIAAPGGGDNYRVDGIWAAKTGGGYTRKSGTSMSAPHIAGGLAVIMEAFPNLNSQSAARRMLQTATYEGLVTQNGCTISSCGTTKMREVFGRGQMNLSAALAPVLNLSVALRGQSYDERQIQLNTSQTLYPSLSKALASHRLLAVDSFDGAKFALPTHRYLLAPKRELTDMFTSSSVPSEPLLSGGDTQHYLYSGHSPVLDTRPEQLIDLSRQAPDRQSNDLWYVIDHFSKSGRTKQQGWTARLGYRENRQSASLIYRWQPNGQHYWLGQGASHDTGSWLDSTGTGVLAIDGSTQLWQFAGTQHQLGSLTARAEFLYGQSEMSAPGLLIEDAEARLSSWLVNLSHKATRTQSVSVSLGQPLTINGGHIGVVNPISGTYQQLALSAPYTENQLKFGWSYSPASNLSVSAYHQIHRYAGQQGLPIMRNTGLKMNLIY